MNSSAQRREPSERAVEAVADRRSKILEAGLVLFAERGFDGVSIRDIAGQAGVNVGLLYHYFDDKRSLYEAVLQDAVDQQTNPHVERLEVEGDAPTRLRAFVGNLIAQILLNEPRRQLVERRWSDGAGPLPASIQRSRRLMEPKLRTLIAEIAPQGGDIPWPVISGIISGLPQSILRSHRAYEPGATLDAAAQARLADMLTQMMIAAFRIAAQEARDRDKYM